MLRARVIKGLSSMRMAPTWTADVIGCVSNRIVQEERRVRSKQSVSLAFNRWSKKGKLQMGWLSSENLKERESTRSPSTLVLCEDIVNRIGSARATRCREFRGDYGWRGSAGLWGAPGAKAPLPRLSDTALKGRSSTEQCMGFGLLRMTRWQLWDPS